MRCLVTGVAGFIGSTLAERLVADGHDVVGVDSFTPYYERAVKERNLVALRDAARCSIVEVDLTGAPLDPFFDGVDAVFHLAGQPGVRASWDKFDDYVQWNVAVTQRLLDQCRRTPVGRFVYSSSSSVYGDAERFPTAETDLPKPKNPYGVTKLAAEHLCLLYATVYGVPTVSLRYFTVYGPRQRPDMAMQRLCLAARDGAAFPLNGDGSQVRDFTFVDDVVAANVLSATVAAAPGAVYNVGGGSATSLSEVIAIVERLAGRTIALDRRPFAAGDAERTGADTSRIRSELGWAPTVDIEAGLARQIDWNFSGR